ncbi:MAG: hypothetical protein IJV15_15810 [Lachnospiraceae bacterium]|nr:hypothetical protein [Lachnospiraceae bacterium]
MKRKILITTLVVLSCLACGCGEDNSNEESQTSEHSEGMIGDDAFAKRQIEIFVENESEWKASEEGFFYTVTDLDHNGRLELIAAINQGSGLFTYADIYEINETNDGLNKCSYGGQENEELYYDYPDFIKDGNFITFTNGTDYIYIASNYTRVSAMESGETIEAFSLSNGNFSVETLAMKYVNGEDVSFIRYPDETEISEDEFNKISIDKYGNDYTKTETSFAWDDLSGDDISIRLLNCYKTFESAEGN